MRLAALAALGLLLVACTSVAPGGSASPSAGSPGPTAAPSGAPASGSPAPDAMLLRIAADGGFVPPGYLVTRLPSISVYADGRVIEPGAVPAIYPGPASAPLVLHRLGRDGIEGIRAAARGAGLAGPDRAYNTGVVADVETTVITFWDAAGPHRLAIYALGFDPGPAASAEERAARTAAANLVKQVRAYVDATTGESYMPTAYRVYPTRATSGPSGEPAPNVLDWPADLPALATMPAASLPPGAGCAVLEGAAATSFRALLASATAITRYRQAGTEWTLLTRPLLPDEARTCR